MMPNKKNDKNDKVIMFPGKRRAEQKKIVLNEEPISSPISSPISLSSPGISSSKKCKSRQFPFNREQRKVLVSASLVIILFGVTIANRVLLDNNSTSTNFETSQSNHSSRSIASVGSNMRETRNTEWEKKLVDELLRPGARGPVSIGKPPTVLERLQFGFLEGKYAVKMNRGKIENLRFVAVFERPKRLENPSAFLVQHMDLMPSEFEKARLIQREKHGRTVRETYSLDFGSSSVGRVDIEMDYQGRLLTLAVVQ